SALAATHRVQRAPARFTNQRSIGVVLIGMSLPRIVQLCLRRRKGVTFLSHHSKPPSREHTTPSRRGDAAPAAPSLPDTVDARADTPAPPAPTLHVTAPLPARAP